MQQEKQGSRKGNFRRGKGGVLVCVLLCMLLLSPYVPGGLAWIASVFPLPATGGSAFQTEFGFHFASQYTPPTTTQLQQLRPQWLRYGPVVHLDYPLPTFPTAIKTLIVFNNESTGAHAPLGATDVSTWDTYITTGYLPALKQFLATYHDITALEVWNEEDNCPGTFFCPRVPPQAYAYMLASAAQVIKAYNTRIRVIMGGLASGDIQYVTDVRKANAGVFTYVDAIGLHPYGRSPNGWCASGCANYKLPLGDLATEVTMYKQACGLPIWITEIGAKTGDQKWQAEYLSRSFSVLSQIGVPVVIWYGLNDGGNGPRGLVDSYGKLKLSGKAFRAFTPRL